MPRRNFSDATIKARLKHAGFQCEAVMADGSRCLVKAEPGRFQCDHDNPDGLTGEPTFENARILCLAHHAEKTARDVANIAKAKRRETRHMGIKRATALSGPPRAELDAIKSDRGKARSAPGKPPVPSFRNLYAPVQPERRLPAPASHRVERT